MDTTTLTTAQKDAMKSYGVRVVEDVATEPVTLEKARLQLRIVADSDGSPYDDWLEQIGIPAAREWCEGYSGLSIGAKTLELATAGFPTGGIPLLYGPVTSVISVTYTDTDGVDVVMTPSDFEYDQYAQVVNPPFGESWPAAQASPNSVRIQYTVGFDEHNAMPFGVLAAMLLIIGHLDANRENSSPVQISEIPTGAQNFLDQVRVRLGMA
jgi:uncharacterized phiE125 gp8 family phage protein